MPRATCSSATFSLCRAFFISSAFMNGWSFWTREKREHKYMSTFPTVRMRRTRQNEQLRGLIRETHLNVEQLIYPLFIAEDLAEPRPIAPCRVSCSGLWNILDARWS